MTLITKTVESLVPGDLVDLASCPYFKDHAMAEHQYGEVDFCERETEACVLVGYEGIDQVGYPVGTELQVLQQEIACSA